MGDKQEKGKKGEKSGKTRFFAVFCRFYDFYENYFWKIQGCAESRMTSELRAHTDHSCAR